MTRRADRRVPPNAFDMTCGGHPSPGLWRHSRRWAHRDDDIRCRAELAQLLERGRVDSLIIADVVGVVGVDDDDVDGDALETALREGRVLRRARHLADRAVAAAHPRRPPGRRLAARPRRRGPPRRGRRQHGHDAAGRAAEVDDLRARTAAAGRDPLSIEVLTLMTVITAPTDEEAQAEQDEYASDGSPDGARAVRRLERTRPLDLLAGRALGASVGPAGRRRPSAARA